jgi:cyclopropane fatty-acyl-phospholipid synthase-like methyltransferase
MNMFNYPYINSAWNAYKSTKVSDVISPKETMNNQWYFEVGENAVHVVLSALASSHLGYVKNVLDIPCGHGRVLRHLVKAFPDAAFTACDLDADGVDFCAKEFGAIPVYSQPNLSQVRFPRIYDVIWVGSLFTHVCERDVARWLEHLSFCLSETGIIVATFHGRKAIDMYHRVPYISQNSWNKIIDQYQSTGFGYEDYDKGENHEYIDHSYGVSLSSPEKIMSIVQKIHQVRIFSYIEAGWADNQDVLVFGKPGL